MKSLLIVYHSQSGATASLAEAAWQGAGDVGGVTSSVLRAVDADISAVAAAAGVLLATPENSGYLSGGMKEFLDRIFYPAIERGLVLPYALLVSAGNDGRNAVSQAQRILSGIPFTPASEPLILRGEVNETHRARARELGEAFATGLEMGVF